MMKERIVFFRNILCVLNSVLAVIAIYLEGEFNEIGLPILLGGLFVLLSPIFFWNRWLYEGLFENERSRLMVSYDSFQVIGLFLVITAFLAITFAYDWP